MRITIEVSESDILTIAEVIKKAGLEHICKKALEGNPLMFEYEDESGKGTFDLASGEVERTDDGEGNDFNLYEYERGCYSLAEVIDEPYLVWGENEEGETVAFIGG